MKRMQIALLSLVLAAAVTASADDVQRAEHPFILWNAEDIAAIQQRIETEPWAKQALQELQAGREPYQPDPIRNLFRYAILDDQQAGEKEKAELMRMARSPVPQGMAQWVNVVRYDLLYDLLTEAERKTVEDTFRTYIELAIHKRDILDPNIFNDSNNFSRYDARVYSKSNWLPNIIWPRKVSANLMAAALQDEQLIRETWKAYGSWKWYFDEYLSDVGFYQEEFSKQGSTPGAMLLYCRALQRLGLNELGYGYTGPSGQTMRGHIAGLVHLGYPQVTLHSGRPHYPMVTMGDLRQGGSSIKKNLPTKAFQHSIVMGYLPDGRGGNNWWLAHGAWGGVIRGDHPQWDGYSGFTPKMQLPFWFEIGAKQWPDAGLEYF
ncbi:MAG: hypothetical protein ACOC93_01580, partial [Planctomycetota bacterium]